MSPETEIVSAFRKSSYSAQSNDCVEIARTADGGRAVRDSKNPAGSVQFYSAGQWAGFLAVVKAGELPSV